MSVTSPFSAAEETAGRARTTNNTATAAKPTNNRRNQECANGGRDATNMGAPGLMARAPSAFGSPAISPTETRGFAYPPHDGAAFIGRSGLFTYRTPNIGRTTRDLERLDRRTRITLPRAPQTLRARSCFSPDGATRCVASR